MKIGVAQGRFHIVHFGHMEYLLECCKRCDYLLIGISDMDPSCAYFDYSDILEQDKKEMKPFRSFEDPIYPFTFFERMQMLKLALLEHNIKASFFDIVPFPIHKPWLIKYYIPKSSNIFVTIYDKWGEYKVKLLQELGFAVQVLWKRSMQERFTTGTEVRKRLLKGEDFQDLVPRSVYKFLKEFYPFD
ncbi:MAG: hypothetical protein PWR24_761 [Desulfonauticus sp.]|jgi:nicotinamide-nucleotide adenylyltransferase/phosphinothricin biosynthesis protein PhpF|nr:MAG: Cytidyltransferase-like domain-containing protein [Desulfonauticus sp. 38_4375]MDK2921204.1 hypothetical protein [Desulfonauticus sp.]